MTEPRKTKGKPDPIDVHVGQMIRIARDSLGMSQEKLAEAMDLTFQQIQKYERGTNRIAAGRLFLLARILKQPLSYFFPEGQATNSDKIVAALETVSSIQMIMKQNKDYERRLRHIARTVPQHILQEAGV